MRRHASKSPHKPTEVDDTVFIEECDAEVVSPSNSDSFRIPIETNRRFLHGKKVTTRIPESTVGIWEDGMIPIKSGFLSKLSTGKWKRRRWHQRWFVLQSNGTLSYFKYERNASSRRHEPQDSVMLRGTNASLTIQVDVPRGTPTSYCFAVSLGSKTFLICAESQDELREWTGAISAAINPDDPGQVACISTTVLNDALLDDDPDEQEKDAIDVTSDESYWNLRRESFGVGAILAVNSTIALLRYGNWHFVLATMIMINVSLLWYFQHQDNNTRVSDATASYSSLDEILPSPTQVTGTVNGTKAIAGCSVKECPPDPAPYVAGCWSQLSATRFNVRCGPNYRRTKLKSPSSVALLDLIATDAYRSDIKIDNIGSVVQLPDLPNGRRDILIINCQVPCYPPSNPLWGEQRTDGDGFNFVTYYAIPPHIRAKLDEGNPSDPAIKLFKGFLQDGHQLRERLKAIGIVVNPTEQSLGRMEKHLLETYNGQPILTRPQHRFYRGDGYVEVDIDAHIFNFVARKGLSGVSEHIGNMVVDFGFVLEGQEDEELPEQILGCVRLCKVDVKNAPRLA